MPMTAKCVADSVPAAYCGTCGEIPQTGGTRCPICKTRSVYSNRNEYVRAEGARVSKLYKRRNRRRKLIGLYVYLYKGLSACCLVGAPYITLLADRYAFMQRGYYGVGGEFLVPIYLLTTCIILYATGTKVERYFGYGPQKKKRHDLRRYRDEE